MKKFILQRTYDTITISLQVPKGEQNKTVLLIFLTDFNPLAFLACSLSAYQYHLELHVATKVAWDINLTQRDFSPLL